MAKHKKPAKTFSHFDARGSAAMVDVTTKPPTRREARAHAFVRMKPSVVRKIRTLKTPKGNPLEVARLAGIGAAKRTDELIPLAHPLPLSHIDVSVDLCQNGLRLTSSVRSMGPTGVEMEALAAVAVAALTVYDMCKALDRSIEIREIYLVEKAGGRSGTYRRRRK